MTRLLMGLVVLGAVVAGVGFYRGWFHLTSGTGADTSNITLTVDKDKIQQDRRDAQGKVEALEHQAKDKVVAPSEKSKNP